MDEIFSATVARGWAPRTPAYGADLARCEATHMRGDCVAPLLLDGDTAYIDPLTPPLPGDLVSFALSARGAAAQNSALPAGQHPWRPGDRWTKLLAHRHGFAFLLDRHGHAATATLMCCESPDDTPVLWPVRNVRRNGRLLFGPESCLSRRSAMVAIPAALVALAACDGVPMLPPCSDGAELGLNSATITDTAHYAPTGQTLSGVTGVTLLNPTMTMTNSPAYDCTAIVTLNITVAQTAGTIGDVSILIVFADDNVTHVDSTSTFKLLSSSNQQYTLQWEFSHLGTNAGLGKVWAAADPGSTADSISYGPCTLQVEYVVR